MPFRSARAGTRAWSRRGCLRPDSAAPADRRGFDPARGGAASARKGGDHFAGRYFGAVVRVIDADAFEARVAIGPMISARIGVRLRGVDAPELFRPGCVQERPGAVEARDAPGWLVPAGMSGAAGRRGGATPSPAASWPRCLRQGEVRGRTQVELLTRRRLGKAREPGDAGRDWCAILPER